MEDGGGVEGGQRAGGRITTPRQSAVLMGGEAHGATAQSPRGCPEQAPPPMYPGRGSSEEGQELHPRRGAVVPTWAARSTTDFRWNCRGRASRRHTVLYKTPHTRTGCLRRCLSIQLVAVGYKEAATHEGSAMSCPHKGR